MRRALLLLAALAAAAPAQDGPRPGETWADVFTRSQARSLRARAAQSLDEREAVDALRQRLDGTTWAGELGLGSFAIRQGVLWFEVGERSLPFLPLERPQRWLIGSNMATTTGTADVRFELAEDGTPTGMVWVGEFRFEPVAQAAFALTPEDARALLEQAADALEALYVVPDVGRSAAEALRGKADAYARHRDVRALAEALAADVRALTGDVQAGARFSPLPIEEAAEAGRDGHRHGRIAHDLGVGLVTVVQGTVGFVELTHLVDADLMARPLAEAMRRVADTDALILDLRRNASGPPETVELVASYFLPAGTHLGDLEIRSAGELRPRWTREEVGGPRFLERPLYVLVSADTLGAGEDVAYTLQQLGRATVVGERTAGGAFAARAFPLHPHLAIVVPDRRTHHARTGGDWADGGVVPDIETDAEGAYVAALHAIATGR